MKHFIDKHLLCLFAASTLLVLLPAPRATAETTSSIETVSSITGVWDATVETDQGSGTPVFTFQQEGTAVSGQYAGQLGDARLTGEITDQNIIFKFTVNVGEAVTCVYTGKVEGDTIKGTMKLGTFASGTFVAKRRAM